VRHREEDTARVLRWHFWAHPNSGIWDREAACYGKKSPDPGILRHGSNLSSTLNFLFSFIFFICKMMTRT